MDDDKEKMINAYSLLYDIEQRIVLHVTERFQDYFENDWKKHVNKYVNFHNANFRELISYFSYYPLVFPHIDKSTIRRLYNLYAIRNKICHMKPISDQDYNFLVECHKNVFEICLKKVR